MTDNNQNHFEFGYVPPADPVMEELCRVISMYPEGYEDFQSVIPEEQSKSLISNDINDIPTLNKINVLEDDADVKEFFDLDKFQPNHPEMVGDLLLPSEGIFKDEETMDWAYDQTELTDPKQEVYNYTMAQQPVETNRMEIDYQAGFTLATPTSGALLSPDDTNCPPSPTSTICSFASELINNNENYKKSSRNRKMSFKVEGKGGKIEKPYRSRRTKAEMEEMSVKEKVALKQEQNRENAKKCVARKNESKKQLTAELPELEANLEHLKEKNLEQQKGLSRSYNDFIVPVYDNNSPYGIPSEFEEVLKQKRNEAIQTIVQKDENNLDFLKQQMEDAQDKFDAILQKDQKDMKQNTYASQKSRAKSSLELATVKCQNWNLRFDIAIEQLYSDELAKVAMELKPYLRRQGRPIFSEDRVPVEFDQYEPS